jgi:hypothetical protein
MSRRLDKTWLVFMSLENATRDGCVDIFERPDKSCGFEAFRRDAEDCGAWTAISYFCEQNFPSRRAALEAAMAAIPWLAAAAHNHASARRLLAL